MNRTCLIGIFALFTFCTIGSSAGCSSGEEAFTELRERMVRRQIIARGIDDERVVSAMLRVPRHRFVPMNVRTLAYIDSPLPIGLEQTISQPYIVALMTASVIVGGKGKVTDSVIVGGKGKVTDSVIVGGKGKVTDSVIVEGKWKVLEVGTGSGYQAAVLAEIVDSVYTVEIIPELARRAAAVLDTLGYGNVLVRAGDGYDGWPEAAPFDGVIVTAAAPKVPRPLIEQLREGGRLVIPVGDHLQSLHVYEKRSGELELLSSLPVRFVPMTGKVRKSKNR